MSELFQTNMVNSLLKGLDALHQKSLSLTPGQVFNGKILKLYPGQLASLQLAGVTLTAKLQAALTVGNRYWFKVQPSDGIPVLKVLEGSSGQHGDSSSNLLRQLGIVDTKVNEMIVNHLSNKELPFSKQHVTNGGEILKNIGMVNERGLQTLQFMIKRNLPITQMSFSAIQSVVDGQSLSQNVQRLTTVIQQMQINSPALQQLEEQLLKIKDLANIKFDNEAVQNNVSRQLQSLIRHIGFHHERDAFQVVNYQNVNEKILLQLKSLLIKAQQLDLPIIVRDNIEQVLNRITGQQLISISQDAPVSNYAVVVPIKLLDMETDLTIQWEGKKQSDGLIDPDHCRILFYIHLQLLKETIVDVQIQNRIVSLHIYNENEKPVEILKQFQPLLSNTLKEKQYQLSSVKWINPREGKRNIQNQKLPIRSKDYYQRPYQGVDIRI